jgi:predicted  nucleic acid-binding Zn-ribbon protein
MAGTADRAAGHLLHVCPDCGSNLVQPTSWEQESDRARWRVWRRCPECEWAGEGVHSLRAVDAYDEQLDLGAHEIANELRALEHANMAELAEAFGIALRRDLICADDFRPGGGSSQL